MKTLHLRTFSVMLAACGAWSASAANAETARGLIVRLHEPTAVSAATDGAALRDAPLAARARLAQVVRESGVRDLVAQDARAVGSRHLLLPFAQLKRGAELEQAIWRLQQNPAIASVEADVRLKRQAVPNDPRWPDQWHLQSPVFHPVGLNLPAAWDVSTGKPIVTAVLDTGIRPHPDLAGQVLPGYDFVTDALEANDGDGRDADPSDPGDWVSAADKKNHPLTFDDSCSVEDSSWHGTFIAGQIAAASNNTLGLVGVSWGAKILPVRVSGKCGSWTTDLYDGMRWAAGLPVKDVPANPNPARVINLSFGGSGACNEGYQSAIDDVTAKGALVVVASGNESGQLTRPADCRKVLAVAGVTANGAKASYANYGANLALAAPGGESTNGLLSLTNLGTTTPGADSYGYMFGSSFSAPLASGVAALMLSVNPALTPAELTARMKAATRAHLWVSGLPTCSAFAFSQGACNCTTSTCGAGLLDAALAVQAAASPGAGTGTGGSTPPGGGTSNGGGAAPSSGGGGGGATGLAWGTGLWLLAAWSLWRQGRRGQSGKGGANITAFEPR